MEPSTLAAGAPNMFAVAGFILLLFWLVPIGICGIPFYRILQRAGLHRGLIALLAVPLVGILAMLSVLAFSNWPNEPEGYR
ncbi:MAG: hypothetical protein WC729_13545 [Sphingomonas sp.]|jgi:hypothetical protein|uniref:hypothetical protein n=1 Tax=Sphingomonas sp. TaxID=28214 RepID=UPI003565BF7F